MLLIGLGVSLPLLEIREKIPKKGPHKLRIVT